jgi:hypothetical protein
MSSHHFVKEGQEPALLITDALQFNHIGSLLEWAPLVIVLENALDYALLWGIKADIVISTTESLHETEIKIAHQVPVKILSCSTADDFFKTAMELLIVRGERYVTVCVREHGTYFKMAEEYKDALEITLFDGKHKWSAIPTAKFTKWLPAGSTLSVRSSSSFQVKEGEVKVAGNDIFILKDSLICIESTDFFWIGEPQ